MCIFISRLHLFLFLHAGKQECLFPLTRSYKMTELNRINTTKVNGKLLSYQYILPFFSLVFLNRPYKLFRLLIYYLTSFCPLPALLLSFLFLRPNSFFFFLWTINQFKRFEFLARSCGSKKLNSFPHLFFSKGKQELSRAETWGGSNGLCAQCVSAPENSVRAAFLPLLYSSCLGQQRRETAQL